MRGTQSTRRTKKKPVKRNQPDDDRIRGIRNPRKKQKQSSRQVPFSRLDKCAQSNVKPVPRPSLPSMPESQQIIPSMSQLPSRTSLPQLPSVDTSLPAHMDELDLIESDAQTVEHAAASTRPAFRQFDEEKCDTVLEQQVEDDIDSDDDSEAQQVDPLEGFLKSSERSDIECHRLFASNVKHDSKFVAYHNAMQDSSILSRGGDVWIVPGLNVDKISVTKYHHVQSRVGGFSCSCDEQVYETMTCKHALLIQMAVKYGNPTELVIEVC